MSSLSSAGGRSRTVVVGGGIAGLAAAWFAAEAGHDVLLLEGADRVGGKLRTEVVGGVVVDVGAEAMLHRRPEGLELARAAGLETVHPATIASRLWVRDRLRPLPRSLMGAPLDLDDLARSEVLTPDGLARARREPSLPPTVVGEDLSVGDLVAQRFGDEVTDLLVEPLLGGVYAGRARDTSARAAVPQLVAMAERGSIVAAGADLPPPGEDPVFAGLPGGMGRLPEALAASGRFKVRLGATVRAVARTPEGFRLTVGPTNAAEHLDATRVVIATPAAAAARLLERLAPVAATTLAAVETASVVVVTFAFWQTAESEDAFAAGSGFLVPPTAGLRIKASTFSSSKWAWTREAGLAEGLLFARTSLGRHGEATALQATDEELVAWSLADLETATGLRQPPVDVHVQRWGGGLPQYALGHLGRVERIRADVARVPGLAVCGATYDGVGIPAVIGSARRAVASLTQAQ